MEAIVKGLNEVAREYMASEHDGALCVGFRKVSHMSV